MGYKGLWMALLALWAEIRERMVCSMADERIITSINGKDAEWTPEIWEKWNRTMAGIKDQRPVTRSNYFTPRPYVDEYNSGSDYEGFTYVRKAWPIDQVFQVQWRANDTPTRNR
jgi:hypothetical protein